MLQPVVGTCVAQQSRVLHVGMCFVSTRRFLVWEGRLVTHPILHPRNGYRGHNRANETGTVTDVDGRRNPSPFERGREKTLQGNRLGSGIDRECFSFRLFFPPSFLTIPDDGVVEMIPFFPFSSIFSRMRPRWSGLEDTCGCGETKT